MSDWESKTPTVLGGKREISDIKPKIEKKCQLRYCYFYCICWILKLPRRHKNPFLFEIS